MRNDLATDYQADKTCPVTTGIFTPFWRIVNLSEASYEELKKNQVKKIIWVLTFEELIDLFFGYDDEQKIFLLYSFWNYILTFGLVQDYIEEEMTL